jgi:hypothetical protein
MKRLCYTWVALLSIGFSDWLFTDVNATPVANETLAHPAVPSPSAPYMSFISLHGGISGPAATVLLVLQLTMAAGHAKGDGLDANKNIRGCSFDVIGRWGCTRLRSASGASPSTCRSTRAAPTWSL